MRGRKPKPTRLKVIDGNPGRRPLNKREPVPERRREAVTAAIFWLKVSAGWCDPIPVRQYPLGRKEARQIAAKTAELGTDCKTCFTSARVDAGMWPQLGDCQLSSGRAIVAEVGHRCRRWPPPQVIAFECVNIGDC